MRRETPGRRCGTARSSLARSFSRNHRAPCTDRHEHPTIAQAVAPRPRPVPLAHVPNVQSQDAAVPVLAADLPTIWCGSVARDGRTRVRREPLPGGLFARAEKNKTRLAGPVLSHRHGWARHRSLAAVHSRRHSSISLTNRPTRSEVAPREAFGLGGFYLPGAQRRLLGPLGASAQVFPTGRLSQPAGSRFKFQQLEGHSPTSSETSRKAHSTISESSRPPFHLYQPKGLTGRWPVIT